MDYSGARFPRVDCRAPQQPEKMTMHTHNGFWIIPGSHEQIDLDHCAIDPDWDDPDYVLDQIIAAAEREEED